MKSRSGGHPSPSDIYVAILQIQMFVVMPIVIMPDGWIHDFKTRSVKISFHSFNPGIFIYIFLFCCPATRD
jgi:hypothetical protein